MKLFAFAALLFLLNGCAHMDWNPDHAAPQTEHDIRSHHIMFYFVEGYAGPHSPGVPLKYYQLTKHYPRRHVSGYGCDSGNPAEEEYARRYNQRILAYLAKH